MLAALQIKGDVVRSLQILVVDDDDADALMIEEALAAAETQATVDRVTDGREALAAIKTDDRLKAIPVVILTTSGAAPDIVASYQQRANAYVTKPFGL